MTKIIHTGMYNAKLGYVLTNIWKCIRYRADFSRRTKRMRALLRTWLEVLDDNEIVFKLESDRNNEFYYVNKFGNDARILDHLAWELKSFVVSKNKGKYGFEWSRMCEYAVRADSYSYSDADKSAEAPVKDIYYFYDKLRGRKLNKWTDDTKNDLNGIPLDPIAVEFKLAQKEEIAKLKEQANAEIKIISDKRSKLRNKLYDDYKIQLNAFDAETKQLTTAITAKYDSECAKILEELNNLTA